MESMVVKSKHKHANQRKLVDSVAKNDMVFAIGPAGTGKTYTGVALAVKALKNKEVKRIILTRPCCRSRRKSWLSSWRFKRKVRSLYATTL